MKNYPFFQKTAYFFLIFALFFSSCKKNEDQITPFIEEINAEKLALLDSMRIYYYWNSTIPNKENIDVKLFGSTQAVLDKVRHSLDKFSVVANLQQITNQFAGVPEDFGIGALKLDAQNNLRIGYVYKESPLGKEGVTRGCILQKIGGKEISSTTFNAEIAKKQNSFEIKFLDGTVKTINASQNSYKINAILSKKIIVEGNKKIAYLAYNSFLGTPSESKIELSNVFGEFKQAGVNELILDLRYNGGGYISTMTDLVNLIAPSSANGKILYQQKWNSDIQRQFGEQIAKNAVKVARQTNSLDLERVVIITTKNSASASEQTINNLKPFLNVVTVGTTTYGKPAFNNIFAYKNTAFYLTLGVIANSNGEGDFFNGISPSILTADDVSKDFGDMEETSLKQSLNYIKTGAINPNGKLELETEVWGDLQTWSIMDLPFKK